MSAIGLSGQQIAANNLHKFNAWVAERDTAALICERSCLFSVLFLRFEHQLASRERICFVLDFIR